MRNTRSAGPSGAPKSTFGDNRAKAREGGGDGVGTGVGNGQPAGKTGGRLGLPVEYRCSECFGVGGATGRPETPRECRDHRRLVGTQIDVEGNEISVDDRRAVAGIGCAVCHDVSLRVGGESAGGWLRTVLKAGDAHGVRIDGFGSGKFGAGQLDGGAAVRDRVPQAVRVSVPGTLCDEVAGQGRVPGAHGAAHRRRGRRCVPRTVGSDEDCAGRPERRENRSDAPLDQNPAGVDYRADITGCGARLQRGRVGAGRAERVRRSWA